MSKTNKTQPDNTFPPFEFGLGEYSDHSSLYGALYHIHAERMEEFVDFLSIAGKLIIKHARKVYRSTLAEFEFQTHQEMPDEYEERLVRVMYWGTHEEFVYEMIFVRLVEIFLIYLTDVIYGILKVRHLSEAEIEKVISKLNTFNAIKQFYANVDFALFTSKKDALEIERIVAMRNLVVHKKGYVDDRFLARFPSLKGISGIRVVEEGLAEVRLNQRTLRKYSTILARVVSKIDKRAIKKFHILTIEEMLERTSSD